MSSRRIFLSAAALGGVSRGISILVRLFSVPMTVTLLSQERYGLWLIINSLIGWFGFSDLGIPAALQNRLLGVVATRDHARAAALVAFALRLLAGIGGLVLLGGIVAGFLVPWGALFKIGESFRPEFIATLLLCCLGLAMGLPSRVGSVIYNAHGRLAMQPLTDVIVQVASFGMLALAVVLQWHSLLALVACSLVGIILGPVFLSALALHKYGYGPFGGAILAEDKRALLGKGFFFFVTMIGELLILQSDAFVIGAMLGAAAVPLFLVPNTLWLNFLQSQNIFLRPLWPVLSRAYAEGDVPRLRHLIGRTLLLSAGMAGIFGMGLVILGGWFIHWWSKGVASLPPVMAWGFAFYTLTAAVDNTLATCLNAFNLIEVRFRYTLVFGISKVGIAIAVLYWTGIVWLPWAFALAMTLTSLPFASFFVLRALRRTEPMRGEPL